MIIKGTPSNLGNIVSRVIVFFCYTYKRVDVLNMIMEVMGSSFYVPKDRIYNLAVSYLVVH